jgi:NADP-dependent 3-hydroxy acid dehydrogenase YdfG
MRSHPTKIAIVTGASQGIGAGIAAGFRRTGYVVVAAERIRARIDRMRERETAWRDVLIEVVRALETQPWTLRVQRLIEGVH